MEGAFFRDQRPLQRDCSGLSLVLVQMGHFLKRPLVRHRSQLQAVSALLESLARLPGHEYNANTVFVLGCAYSSESREGILT